MLLEELKAIEEVLVVNLDVKEKVSDEVHNILREKYGDNYRDKLSESEKETIATSYEELQKAKAVYDSFINHKWQ